MLIYLVGSLSAYLLSRTGLYALSGIIQIIVALYLYIKECRYSKSLVNLRGIFSLAFVGGEGLSAIKLSHLAKPWSNTTWICLCLAFGCFYMMFGKYGFDMVNPILNNVLL